MADGQHANATSAAFPAPPSFYKHFTPEKLEKVAKLQEEAVGDASSSDAPVITAKSLRDKDTTHDLQYLLPPAPPASGKFKIFGESYDLSNTLRTLPSQGIKQLYPPPPKGIDHAPSPTAPNQADKLIHTTRSILLSFLELTDILAKDPSQYGPKIDDLTTLFHNAHHLLNEFRPHQAREMLIKLVEDRIESMRNEIRVVDEMERRVEEVLGGLGEMGGEDVVVPDVIGEKKAEAEKRKIQDARRDLKAMEHFWQVRDSIYSNFNANLDEMPGQGEARDELVNRQLPEMHLSDGTADSMTPPPVPQTGYVEPRQKAYNRFEVTGNAVITGGTGTLALEAARALLEHGVTGLALLDVNASQEGAALKRLRQDFQNIHIAQFQVDVTDSESIEAAFAAAARILGKIDVFCNFAGIVGCTHAIEMDEKEWRRTLDVNSTGSFLCAQAAAKQMKAQGTGGSIVLIASISAHRVNFPQPQVAYNVSKSAALAMVRSLAAEWARWGIRINTISPGYMDTILNEGEGLANARKVWTDRNPMGRMGSPSELTGPLVLLCSRSGGGYITGTDIVVDGGAIVF